MSGLMKFYEKGSKDYLNFSVYSINSINFQFILDFLYDDLKFRTSSELEPNWNGLR